MLIRKLDYLIASTLLAIAMNAMAGAQVEEALSDSVKAIMQKSVSDTAVPNKIFTNDLQGRIWLADMSDRLKNFMPQQAYREDFLRSVYYEASRAGLDVQLVLGLIQVESGFKKYAISTSGARGYMQVMPFWVNDIGAPDQNLFHLRTNLRYGCTILRYYLDIEHGDLFRALGRYNGSLGQPEYPNMVLSAWRGKWSYKPL